MTSLETQKVIVASKPFPLPLPVTALALIYNVHILQNTFLYLSGMDIYYTTWNGMLLQLLLLSLLVT